MRTLVGFSLGGVIGVGIVIFLTPRFTTPERASAIIAAASICVAAGAVAMVPPACVAPRWPAYIMQAGLGAMIIRLFLTLGAGVLYLRLYKPPSSVFMNAMVVSYLLLLVAETGLTLRLVKQHWRSTPSV